MTDENGKTLPNGTLVAWYGDDFTGAAAVMEVLTFAGLPSVLFLKAPEPDHIKRFEGYRGIGIAGAARAKSPEWMEANLPPIFDALAEFGAPVRHYKICSTLDSSPTTGSIGKAIELGAPVLGGKWHPLLVGAPQIGRYQLFGNLFARAGDRQYRLDRHPVMNRHPVTPMNEADVRVHLGKQTDLPIGLVDILALEAGKGDTALEATRGDGARIVAIDTLGEASLGPAGKLIWESADDGIFAIGSQGVEYALVAYWRETGRLDTVAQDFAQRHEKRVVIVSGSCSPVTADQISWAGEHGFTPLKVCVEHAVDSHEWRQEIDRAAHRALAALNAGGDPILYTADGPDDPATGRFQEAIAASGQSAEAVNERVGSGLGRLMRDVMRKAGIGRGVIAGGDTSSHGTAELGIYALTALAPIAPGAALCKAHADDPAVDEFEIALKGGQMGNPDYFGLARSGGTAG